MDNDVARGPCRQAVLDACSTVGFSPAFHIETQDYPTAIRFVAQGMGITVIPRLGLDALPDSTVAVPIVNPTPRRSISVRVRDTAANHPAVIRMLELLDERVTVHHPINGPGSAGQAGQNQSSLECTSVAACPGAG